MSTSSVLDEFVKRLEEKLTQLLDQNIGKDKYAIDRHFYGRAYSYKGRDMRNGILVNASTVFNINFPLDLFRIIWSSTSGDKVINGQWEQINYSTIFVKVAFSWTTKNESYYYAPKSLTEKLLDVLERHNPVEGNTNDGLVAYVKSFEIKSPFGKVKTYAFAARDRTDNTELVRCSVPIKNEKTT